jgi:hypothetical protein
MSRATLAKLRDVAVRAALDVAWAQWGCLTHTAVAREARPVTSIVDVEALVLLSLCLQTDERRLPDLLAALARHHSKLLSVHRMQHLAAQFPDDVLPLVHQFASWAKHPSWTKLGKLAEWGDEPAPRKKELGVLQLLDLPALQLRLRTAFGVGLKSDLLCCLLGQGTESATLADVSTALGYTERNTRIAADDLVDAGFAVRDDYSPRTTYRIDVGSREWFLGSSATVSTTDIPPRTLRWQSWSTAFSFLAHVIVTARRAEQGWSDYVIQSRARDLVETHFPQLIRGKALHWDGRMARESSGLDALERVVSATVGAMEGML